MLKKILNIFSKDPSPEKEPDRYIQNTVKIMNEQVPLMVKEIYHLKTTLMGLEKEVKAVEAEAVRLACKLVPDRGQQNKITQEHADFRVRLIALAGEVKKVQEAYASAFAMLNSYIEDKKTKMHYAFQFINEQKRSHWQHKLERVMSAFAEFNPGQTKTKIKQQSDKTAHDEYIDSILVAGAEKINEIQRLALQIRSPQTQQTITDIIRLVQSIFDSIKDNPEKINQAKEFFMYYLDATLRIIQSYASISQNDRHTNKIDQSLTKADALLQKIKLLCEKQLDSFCEQEIENLDVEMAVLERTIKLEG